MQKPTWYEAEGGLGSFILFFSTASFKSLQTPVHPSNPHCNGLSESNDLRSPHPRTRKVLKYTHTPRGEIFLLPSHLKT